MMHQSQRRFYCRVLFLTLCVLPVLAVVAWGTARRWPGYANLHAVGVSQELGLRVLVDRVEHPRPGQVRYHGVELRDPETDAPIVYSRVVDVYETSTSWQIEASQPEIDARGAQRLWRLVERRLRGETLGDARTWQLTAGELTWKYGELAQTLVDVDGLIAASETGNEAQVSFRLPGSTTATPATLRLVRRIAEGQPALGVSVDSGGASLPAHLFAPLVDGRQMLGPRARFRGYLWFDETSHGWRGEMAGSLSDVELERIVAARFPHVLAGSAEIEIERAVVERGRLEEAAGSVIAGPGQIGRTLLFAGCQHLELGHNTTPLPAENVIPFDRLAFDFALRDGQLALRGRCQEEETAILVARHQVHWRQPPQDQPVVGLIRALVPMNETQVPATHESATLISWLPVPRTVAPQGQTPRAHIKLGSPVPEPSP